MTKNRKTWLQNSLFVVLVPFVGLIIFVGFWMSGFSALETYRFGLLSDQLIGAVTVARNERIGPNVDPARAFYDLMNRYASYKMDIETVSLGAQQNGREATLRVLKNPWDEPISVSVNPAQQNVAFETVLTVPVCRRLLNFFGKDANSIGLVRVAVRDDTPSALWRLVFALSGEKGASSIDPQMAIAGCGDGEKSVVSLTFRLR